MSVTWDGWHPESQQRLQSRTALADPRPTRIITANPQWHTPMERTDSDDEQRAAYIAELLERWNEGRL